jgi:hypothetical protein
VPPLGPLALSAHAGACSKEIVQFEETVRQSGENPGAGPMAPRSKLGHQPTPGSVKRADVKAQNEFDAALTRAKMLDAKGMRKCLQAWAYAARAILARILWLRGYPRSSLRRSPRRFSTSSDHAAATADRSNQEGTVREERPELRLDQPDRSHRRRRRSGQRSALERLRSALTGARRHNEQADQLPG